MSVPLDGARSSNICCYPLTLLAKVVCFPCELFKRIWTAVRSVFSQKVPTAEELQERQRQFTDLSKQLVALEKGEKTPPLRPEQFTPIVRNLGKPVPLTVEGHHSPAIQKLRVLLKQIATIVTVEMLKKWNEAQRNITEEEWNAIVADVGNMCDVLTDQVSTRLEDPKFFPMLFDKIMNYFIDEAKAHAISANEKKYQGEQKKLEHADRVINSKKVTENKRDILEAAEGVKIEKARLGAEHLLQEIYYDSYRTEPPTIEDEEDLTKNDAHKRALAKREEKAKKWGDNRSEKPLDWNSWFKNLDPKLHDQAIALHLQRLYSESYVTHKAACSTDVANIFKAMRTRDAEGRAQRMFRHYIRQIVNTLLEKFLPAAEQIVAPLFIQSQFFKTILKLLLKGHIPDFLNLDEKHAKEITDILTEDSTVNVDLHDHENILPLREKSIEFFEKWILPSELMHQLASNIYPSLQKQLLKTTCRKLVQDHWSDYAPVIYSYIMDGKKGDIFKTNLRKELSAPGRIFSLSDPSNPFHGPAFESAMDELLVAFKRDQYLYRMIINEMQPKEWKELEENFKQLVEAQEEDIKIQQRASIKARIIQACDKYSKQLDQPGEHDPNREKFLENRLKTWNQDLEILVDKVETRLKEVKSRPRTSWTPALISQTIKSAVNGDAKETTSYFGDMTMLLACDFAHAAPWLDSFRLFWGNTLKSIVNQTASGSMEAYRISPDELAKTITETFESKFKREHEVGLEPEKVMRFFFGAGEPKKTDCVKELNEMSKQIYELTLLYFPKGGIKQNLWHWAVKAFGVGNTPDHIHKILTKFHDALFGMRLVNLSRIEKIVDIVHLTLKNTTPQQQQPPGEPKDSIVPPPTPLRRTLKPNKQG